ncbi:YjjG family noncanonical pyrimidine nucleotidase [Chryseolinea lacunae]|uniref:YjjG family noncanonical pyrimidine nucleotidase n=1 Tax=Chryseolinea lacunae TaxID=2801331 RepID=A0ABS1KLA2_9BACT|nr:YjjG family noncanonical pyrimidine nucleotidase [Chryseolinea lacunae]MBL0740238.1 YjjG family noncanonical pyrimidine nucleotidase [Chryseolinea lacunae]
MTPENPNDTPKQHKVIFFDLDHTLWDYELNSAETLRELYEHHRLQERGVTSHEHFLKEFQTVNAALWVLYDQGLIDSDVIRKERFKKVLTPFGAYEEKLCYDISHEYLHTCPQKGNLIPHAFEVLTYLKKHYQLTVITNGFEEIQHLKLASGNLQHFFDHVVTSQKAGHKKPRKEIFDYALDLNGIKHHEAVMVGDNLVTDIGGARNAGVEAVYFNPERVRHESTPDYEIASLHELYAIL